MSPLSRVSRKTIATPAGQRGSRVASPRFAGSHDHEDRARTRVRDKCRRGSIALQDRFDCEPFEVAPARLGLLVILLPASGRRASKSKPTASALWAIDLAGSNFSKRAEGYLSMGSCCSCAAAVSARYEDPLRNAQIPPEDPPTRNGYD